MKVLFLTRYPYEGASSRYRVYQYLPHLNRLGVDAKVSSFMSSRLYGLSFQKGRTLLKLFLSIWAVVRRLAVLTRFKSYDVIYMQRELLPFGPPVLERFMKRCGAVLVFDYDDALFIHKPSRYNRLATLLRAPNKIYDVFDICDGVLTGNDFLRDAALPYCKAAITLEVAEDTDRIKNHGPHNNDDGILIGWLGSTSTVKYILPIADVLREIKAKHPGVHFEVVGGGDFALEGLEIKNTKWSLDGELEALARFDIGIMPLPMEDWSKGKSGGKARTYMAAGLPAVCQNIGYNQELIDHGRTGMLVKDNAEWKAALHALITDPDLRERIGNAARAEVKARFSAADKAKEMRDYLAHLMMEKKDA